MLGTEERGHVQAEAANIIRATAIELSGCIDALADRVSRLIARDVPDVLDGDSYRASNRANLDTKLSALRHGSELVVPPAPADAVLYARDLARRGADVSVLLRAYELGHRLFWSEWTQRFTTRASDPAVLAELYEVSARFLFAYFDAVPAAVTDAYRVELQRQAGSAAEQRAELVCAVLGGTGPDARIAGPLLRYPLVGARHVALVFAGAAALDPADLLAATRTVHGLAARLGGGQLTVQAQTARLWAWVEVPATVAPPELDAHARALRCPDGLTLGLGDPGDGGDGFRDSHREAERALRHAAGPDRVVHYRDVSAASLLAGDPARARRFVARELGTLAADDPGMERMRATLRAFLAEHGNQAATARRLSLHPNTIGYRLKQAEELLGHPLAQRRFELEAALLLQRDLDPSRTAHPDD